MFEIVLVRAEAEPFSLYFPTPELHHKMQLRQHCLYRNRYEKAFSE
jgi:hypothetical protein